MHGNFVFDIDGVVAIVLDMKSTRDETLDAIKRFYGEAFLERYRIDVIGYPHIVYPGYYALLQWIHSFGGRIMFFSSGVEERNVPLVDEIMRRSFGDRVGEVDYKVFSRQHCVDTDRLEIIDPEAEKEMQGFFYGRLKKRLADIVSADELPDTLLVDDDTSYMVKGEEYNFIGMRYSYYYYTGKNDFRIADEFVRTHNAFYVCGLLTKIFECAEKDDLDLRDAARKVQIEGEGKELSREFYYPSIYRDEYYYKGLEVLKGFDPELKFYIDPGVLEEKEV